MNQQLQAARDRLMEINKTYKELLAQTGPMTRGEATTLTEGQWRYAIGQCETESKLLRSTIFELIGADCA